MKTKTIKWFSRVAMMLLLTMLTTATAWADDVNLTENTNETEGTAERWYVNIPKTGENKLTLTDASIIFFKVYDNGGGPQNHYDNDCDGSLVLTAPEGCVLFHCSVGKDRTGILAALLLMLAGCDRWDAFASYVPSRVNIMRLPFFRPYWDKICSDNEREHYDSRPETLGHWFDRLDAEFGGDVRAYLAWCGVSEKTMDAVRARLVE